LDFDVRGVSSAQLGPGIAAQTPCPHPRASRDKARLAGPSGPSRTASARFTGPF
jgi:hypothetical protein